MHEYYHDFNLFTRIPGRQIFVIWALSRWEAFEKQSLLRKTIVTRKQSLLRNADIRWDDKVWRNLIDWLVNTQVCRAYSARWSATSKVISTYYSPLSRRRNEIASQDCNFRPFIGILTELNQFVNFCEVSDKTTIHRGWNQSGVE